nr:DUF3626 domain-containing protein [Micromonospora thermarum]
MFEPVLAALLTATTATGICLGVPADVPTLARTLLGRAEAGADPAAAGRALDDYVEAQVHGELSLARDVEAVVVDPSFRGTETGATFAAAAGRYGFDLRWHAGFELPVERIDRGPSAVTLQHLKQLWHVLVRFGEPSRGA